VVTNVPVIWPTTEDGGLEMPLEPGHTGTLIFAERSLDKWLVSGGTVSPDDPRKFNLSDAQFIPGLRPFDREREYDAANLRIRYKQSKILIGDLITQIVTDHLKAELSKLTVVATEINLGAETPSKKAAIAESVEARLSALESGLASLESSHNSHAHLDPVSGPLPPPTVPHVPFTPDTSVVASDTVRIEP
jgi:hypothetical protein